MVEILNQVGKRKFIIWIIGAGLLSGAIGFGVLDGVYFRDCFINCSIFSKRTTC